MSTYQVTKRSTLGTQQSEPDVHALSAEAAAIELAEQQGVPSGDIIRQAGEGPPAYKIGDYLYIFERIYRPTTSTAESIEFAGGPDAPIVLLPIPDLDPLPFKGEVADCHSTSHRKIGGQ